MPSQLYTNEAVSFLACKPFTYRGKPYAIGDDFPQEEANNIETLVRARFVIPVVETHEDKPRHWHKHIRTREQAEEYLNRNRVQLRMPYPEDSNAVVDLDVLTHPEQTPEPESESGGTGEDQDSEFDPSEHTVNEVKAYIREHPEDEDRVRQAERDGRARKGLLEE
jgi:hypothetical protein